MAIACLPVERGERHRIGLVERAHACAPQRGYVAEAAEDFHATGSAVRVGAALARLT